MEKVNTTEIVLSLVWRVRNRDNITCQLKYSMISTLVLIRVKNKLNLATATKYYRATSIIQMILLAMKS